jgi:hypothetical protein
MTKNTKYSINVNGAEQATRSSKPAAVALAETLKGEGNLVEVVTGAGTVVHTIAPVTKRAKPFTRTETPKGEVEIPAGFEVAYQRVRVAALVLRAVDKDHTPRYLVLQTTTGTSFEAANTTEARVITNAMAAHRKSEAAKAAAAKA